MRDGPVSSVPSPHEGVSPTRHGELPSSRTRDFWGNGRVQGKVSIEGTPAARKVRLFDVLTGLLIAEAWSRKDGFYRFDFLDTDRDYFVLAHDHVRQFNAVIADWVRAEPTVYP
ncbi:HPr kinase [Ralstonia solanacearum]|nr:HPr kinase [Ralstonia solanacearum]